MDETRVTPGMDENAVADLRDAEVAGLRAELAEATQLLQFGVPASVPKSKARPRRQALS